MNFQDLEKIEHYKFYLDLAFSGAKKTASNTRLKKFSSKLQKSKMIESDRVRSVANILITHIKDIIKKFPSFNSMPEFYQELCNAVLDVPEIKRSLSKLNFIVTKTPEFSRKYVSKIKSSGMISECNAKRREYYGRISSLLKQAKDVFILLDRTRAVMRQFPAVKTNIDTVCICGFPNVGKSTLLKKITNANVKINSYAFTTTKLLMGYSNIGYNKVQFIDTPGVLNRKNKQNVVEYQAYLAVKYLAKLCIFVLDLSLSSGYDVKDQLKLYNDLKKRFSNDFVIYLSKTDLMEDDVVNEYIKEYNLEPANDVTQLKKLIRDISD